jgi:uncharacterized membrane protein YqjE
MPRPTPLRNPAGYSGLRENLIALLASLAQFFQSRLQLAARESKAAGINFIVIVACAIAAAMMSVLAYLLLIVFAICGIAYLLSVWWVWITLAAALLHLGGALLCLIIARAKSKGLAFHETRTVLKEDIEWLKHLDHNRTR